MQLEELTALNIYIFEFIKYLLGFRPTVSEEQLLKEKKKHLHYENHQGMTVVSRPAAGFLWCQAKLSILFFFCFTNLPFVKDCAALSDICLLLDCPLYFSLRLESVFPGQTVCVPRFNISGGNFMTTKQPLF